MPLPIKPYAIVVTIALGMFAAAELKREVHPYAGHWVIDTAKVDGQSVTPNPIWRLWLNIDSNGYAEASYWWTCGQRGTTYAEGFMDIKPDDILLFKENWATGERDPFPDGKLLRLANGNLGLEYSEDDKYFEIEFRKESNEETVFDNFGWK